MSMGVIAVGAAVVGSAVSIYGAEKNRQAADKIASDAEKERNAQNALLDVEKAKYEAMEFRNPFERMENKYANLENPYEDLTVNQQQAQFQAQQGAQQRANIMQNLRGAAGGSGIAGLAQALAGQGQLATQQISASIGQQESRNQALRARGAAENIQLEAQGAASVQSLERQGDQFVQQQEISRQSTLLGMQMGQAAGAETAYAGAQANQMAADKAMYDAIGGGISSIGGAAMAAYKPPTGGGASNMLGEDYKLGDLSNSGKTGQFSNISLDTGLDQSSSLFQPLPKFSPIRKKYKKNK